MAVVINEIEILEPAPSEPATPGQAPPAPAAGLTEGALELALRDLDGRRRRLVAD